MIAKIAADSGWGHYEFYGLLRFLGGRVLFSSTGNLNLQGTGQTQRDFLAAAADDTNVPPVQRFDVAADLSSDQRLRPDRRDGRDQQASRERQDRSS